MQGYDAFEPFGLDAFGIHSENYALKTNAHPMEQAKVTAANFYRQMEATGSAIDWSRKLETNDPNYYKWTQWLFVQMFKHGLAERKKAKVNFCPSCKTVLADEQVIDGRCERCGTVVEKRDLEQWFFKITEYAERLLQNLPGLDWAEKVKASQINWIGKSDGAKIKFEIANEHVAGKDFKSAIEIYTTRPDTLYGVTYIVIAPDSQYTKDLLPLVEDNTKREEINRYIKDIQNESEKDQIAEGKKKTGVFSGFYARHPLTGEQLPIWIAGYVLGTYGTGAIMGVPAHDQRDFDFAKKYNLPIKQVIKPAFIAEGKDAPVMAKAWKKRKAVLCIIKHPTEEKYLFVKHRKASVNSVLAVTGGVEEGEDVIAAGKREIAEKLAICTLNLSKTYSILQSFPISRVQRIQM